MALPPALRRAAGAAALALGLVGGAYGLYAQVAGERGIAPTAASADIEVKGLRVDVHGKSAEEARSNGWREAQRQAWTKLGGPKLSDSQLDGLVSAIVIEREQLGPRRYIATLGVIFDRQRASAYLGGPAQASRSAPLLLIPVMESAGAYITFEQRNPWQRAWAEFNPGTSRIDYVRLSGAGGDSLLVNFGQTTRRSRAWWRTMLRCWPLPGSITRSPAVRCAAPSPRAMARMIACSKASPSPPRARSNCRRCSPRRSSAWMRSSPPRSPRASSSPIPPCGSA
jgi:hypothetical protein